MVVSNTHSGACGTHQAGHKMKWLLFRQGVYWPTMLKDCIEFAKGCQECQKHAGIQRVPASELHSIIKPWPFRGWALDVIGEIKPKSSKGHKYILGHVISKGGIVVDPSKVYDVLQWETLNSDF